jgi:ankyrin repeat protein
VPVILYINICLEYITAGFNDEMYFEMLDLLELAGADINERENQNYSALTYAILVRKDTIALHLLGNYKQL